MTARLYALLTALYLLAGRWGLYRLAAGEFTDFRDDLKIDPEWFEPTELRFYLVAGLLVLALLERRRPAPLKRATGLLALSMTAYFTYLLFSSLWSPDIRFAAEKAIELILVVLPCAVLFQAMTGPQAPAVRLNFWKLLYAGTGLIALIALYKAVVFGPERLAVLGGGPNVFGKMMGLLCLAALFFWRRRGGWLHVGVASLGLLLIVLSGSRGCLLAIVAAAGAFFAVERVKLTRLAGLALLGAGALTLVGAFTEVGRRAVDTYEERVNRLMLQEHYSSGRESLYRDAWELGARNPVAGAGLAGFRALRYGVYPHNLFLEVFSEGGALGLLLLLAVFWRFGAWYWQNRGRAEGASIAGLVLMLATAMVSGDLYDGRGIFLFMLLALPPKDPS